MTTRFGAATTNDSLRGPRGYQGVGVDNITFDEDDEEFVVSYTDDTTTNIPFPEGALHNYLVKDNPEYTGTMKTPLTINQIVQTNEEGELISSNTLPDSSTMNQPNINDPYLVFTSSDTELLMTNGAGEVYTSKTLPDDTFITNSTLISPTINSPSISYTATYPNLVLCTGPYGVVVPSNTLPDNIYCGNFRPSTNVTYDLGTSLRRWKTFYSQNILDNGITIQIPGMIETNIIPVGSNVYDLGSSSNGWNNLYSNTVNATTLNVNDVNIGNSIAPNLDNTYDLGMGSRRWRTIYIYDIRMLGTIGSDFVPNNGSRNLGSSSARWNNFYANNSDVNTLIVNTNVASDLLPSGTRNLGSSGNKWNSIYSTNFQDESSKVTVTGANIADKFRVATSTNGTIFGVSTASGSPGVYTGANLYPQTDSTLNLGLSGSKWNNVYAQNFSGSITPVNVNSSLIPQTTATYDIGSTSKKWNKLYTKTLTDDGAGKVTVQASLEVSNPTWANGNWGNISVKGYYYDGSMPLLTMYNDTYESWVGYQGTNMCIKSGSGTTLCQTHFYPFTSNGYNLGASGFRWGSMFVTNVYYYGSLVNSSDGTLKENVEDIDLGLDFINKLTPKKYNYIDDQEKTQRYGLIAQDVASFLPQKKIIEKGKEVVEDTKVGMVVNIDDDGTLGIDYVQLVPILIKSVQQLSAQNDELTRRVEQLENIISANSIKVK